MNKLLLSAALTIGLGGWSALADNAQPMPQEPAPLVDIVDTAATQEGLTKFNEVVMASDLAVTLKEEGPYTVFAPSDDAFAALPEGSLEALMADKDALNNAANSHVVLGELMAEALAAQAELTSASGKVLAIESREDGLYVNGAKIIISDIKASNGIIHVIDTVIMP